MIQPSFEILNQRGTPMFFSDTFVNRPTFGIIGRIFISTDTAQIFRDTGSAWDLIADGGTASTNIYNSNGTLTGNRVVSTAGFNLKFTNGTSTLDFTTNGVLNSNNTYTASASTWYQGMSTVSQITIPANTTFDNGGGAGSFGAQCFQYFNGNTTFQEDTTPSNINARNIISFVNAGSTLTINQGSGGQIRTMSAISGGTFTYTSQAGTITHLSGLQIYDPARVFTSSVTQVNNYYGVLINDASARVALTYTNRWGIYQEGTLDNNYFAGKVNIGSTTITGASLYNQGTTLFNDIIGIGSLVTQNNLNITRAITGNTTASGIVVNSQVATSVTTAARYYQATASTAASGTLTDLFYYRTQQGTFSGTVTNQYGFFVDSTLTGATSKNYGFFSNIAASGLLRYNFYANGTAPNIFIGSVNIGPDQGNLNFVNFANYKNLTGNTVAVANLQSGVIQSDVTGTVYLYATESKTQAAAFTLSNLIHYRAEQLTIGAGSAITNQTGFQVTASMVGATNNYAYRGQLPAAAGNWNLFMDGAGKNHINGNLLLGSTTDQGTKLYLNGTLRIDGQRSATASGASGQHLIINCDGVSYKIALLNP